ncbi:MAG: hypothetical protein AB7F78_18960 [Hyphomicrobiaceae bacterium]
MAKAKPKSKRKPLRKGGRPASAAFRKRMTFKPINAEFDWTNEKWGITWLPRVRLALVTINKSDKELYPIIAGLAKDGMIPDMMDGWIHTKNHLTALVKMIDAALSRAYLMLERDGYDPEKNIPPEGGGDNVVTLPNAKQPAK